MTKRRKKNAKHPAAMESPAETTPPSLRFSPTAWAKLLFLRDYGETEVGGFGISASDDLLLVEDVRLVKQVCSWSHVAFDDASVADYFDQQVDAGRQLRQFARIWVHTHPGNCPRPSMTDEETFDRVFARSDWAVMFILAEEGQSYARLRFNVGPCVELEIPVGVDYTRPFGACDPDAWGEEYLCNVQQEQPTRATEPAVSWYDSWLDHVEGEEAPKGSVL